MDNFQIETAQNIAITQNVAHVTTRIGSYLIDALFIIGYYIIIFLIMGMLNMVPSMEYMSLYLLLGLPTFFYSLLFEILMNGQTPGKFFNQTRVVKIDGSKPTFGSYLIRWLLRIIDFSLASGSVAVLTILLNGKGQRLGDLAAGTTVITEKKRITLRDTIANDISDNYTPIYAQATLLSDDDMHTIKKVYNDARKKRNHKVISKLHLKIIEVTGITTKQNPVDFVDTIIKDYHYFAQQ
ncbi:RDD family protein [Tenacibaculum sp. Bg11-29]|uniref:RDD family protein n=1 Tax=Tenacibaculum sp. Bg11-29 TaxID=2058306 RepID=UPI000C345186|nr:RDD family protein [Tenacibaculum sp. Bg11-29]PKH52247.1 RDD family protein [Tenacibaculum sp. Bg11-29]